MDETLRLESKSKQESIFFQLPKFWDYIMYTQERRSLSVKKKFIFNNNTWLDCFPELAVIRCMAYKLELSEMKSSKLRVS